MAWLSSGPPGYLGLLELPKPRARPSLKRSIFKGDGTYDDGDDQSVLTHYPVSRLIFLLNMASCHFGCFLTPKTPIFGPTWTWNGTWMVHKSAQHIFPHCLGCVLTHFPVSGCVIGLIWQPSIMVYFNPKKGHFWTPPDLEWDQERS